MDKDTLFRDSFVIITNMRVIVVSRYREAQQESELTHAKMAENLLQVSHRRQRRRSDL